MTLPIDTRRPADGENLRILDEQVQAVARAQPLSVLTLLVNAGILSWALFPQVSGYWLGQWLAANAIFAALRLVFMRVFQKKAPGADESPRWAWLFVGVSVASGMLWGAVPLLLWPADSLAHQALVVMVLAGMTAGAVSTLAPLLPAALCYIGLTLAGVLARFLVESGPVADAVAAMAVLFLLMLTVTAVRTHHLVRESLTLRFQRERAEAHVQRQAHYDDLTGLANRRMLLHRLTEELSLARRHDRAGAILFLDLDHFKTINDSLGHSVGDELLRSVAQRLQFRIRGSDMAARLGGDEFVVLLSGLSRASAQADALRVAEEIRRLIRRVFELLGHELHVTASVGVALYPDPGQTAEELLKHADTAMYRAKDAGRDGVRIFLPAMQVAAVHRLDLERELRQAIRGEQLVMHYQPQVDESGLVYGLEALVRWPRENGGFILPGDFVPVAEESGLILELSDLVLGLVLDDMKTLRARWRSGPCPVVSVNLSPREFRRPAFEQRLRTAVLQSGVDPRSLCLEITEGAAMEHVGSVIERMRALRELGISFAIDDFGTGHSSLAYLKRLPVDSLKIDRSFVRDILQDANDAVIVETIIAMANHLGLDVVAEGVESEEVHAFLAARGCRYFQGWLYGRAEALPDILGRQSGRLVSSVPKAS